MSLKEVRAVKAPHWNRDDHGRIITGNLENIRAALTGLNVRVSYDAFIRELRINGTAVVDDLTFEQIWVRITDRYGWQPNRRNLQSVITIDAQAHTAHPVKDYLSTLTWDGVARLETWLIDYAQAPDTKYVRGVSPLPLLAAVRRIMHPGTKFDELLILESMQGTGKSTALRALCPCDDWFSDDLPLGVDAKVVIERTAGKWIIEAAELVGNRGKETDILKAFLSRPIDGPVRQAYGRLSVSVPRQFVMIATTNHGGHYLKDTTGARRFWPVTIKQFNIADLKRDRDQLWAEVVAREPDADLHLATDLWDAAAVEQDARRAVDPWEDVIEARLARVTEAEKAAGVVHTTTITASDGTRENVERLTTIKSQDLWTALGHLDAKAQDNNHATRVALILDRLGYRWTRKAAGVFWELKEKPTTGSLGV